jgi:hypothetical protein
LLNLVFLGVSGFCFVQKLQGLQRLLSPAGVVEALADGVARVGQQAGDGLQGGLRDLISHRNMILVYEPNGLKK